jgi:hypothetical protein
MHAFPQDALADTEGMCCIHHAQSISQLSDTVQTLVRHRPESAWQADDNGNTPLHLAVGATNYAIARILTSRQDMARARVLSNLARQQPADLATTRQMRNLVLTSGHDIHVSVLLMAVENFAYLCLLLALCFEYMAANDSLLLSLTFLGPLACVLEVSWEDMSMRDLSGDEKMVNLALNATGLRLPWECFRFVWPHHYLSRFACFDSARGWQRNRLFTLKQMESLFCLFPPAVVQACCIIQRGNLQSSQLQVAMLVLCLVMYAHTSTSQDSWEWKKPALQVCHKMIIFCLRCAEMTLRVCALALLLSSSLWRVAVCIFVGEWLVMVADWTQLRRANMMKFSFQNLLSSCMNMVGVWEANPFGESLSEILFASKTTNKHRFLGELGLRGAMLAAAPRQLVNSVLVMIYAINEDRGYLAAEETEFFLEWLALLSLVLHLIMLACHYQFRLWITAEVDVLEKNTLRELEEEKELSRVVGYVQIKLLRARDLMDRVTGIPDPYAEAKLGPDSERSESLHNTLNPKWEEELVVYVQARHVADLDVRNRDHEEAHSVSHRSIGRESKDLHQWGSHQLLFR